MSGSGHLAIDIWFCSVCRPSNRVKVLSLGKSEGAHGALPLAHTASNRQGARGDEQSGWGLRD